MAVLQGSVLRQKKNKKKKLAASVDEVEHANEAAGSSKAQ